MILHPFLDLSRSSFVIILTIYILKIKLQKLSCVTFSVTLVICPNFMISYSAKLPVKSSFLKKELKIPLYLLDFSIHQLSISRSENISVSFPGMPSTNVVASSSGVHVTPPVTHFIVM